MTRRTCIAVADASSARLFVHEREATVSGIRDELVEHVDLVNPARRLTNDDLLSDTRDERLDAMDDGFAREIGERFAALAKTVHADRIVICASPHMLGKLRPQIERRDGVAVDELAKDLVKLSSSELHARLARYGVLAPHQRR